MSESKGKRSPRPLGISFNPRAKPEPPAYMRLGHLAVCAVQCPLCGTVFTGAARDGRVVNTECPFCFKRPREFVLLRIWKAYTPDAIWEPGGYL